jgi:D-alanyl-D-alanine carboxypeptidase
MTDLRVLQEARIRRSSRERLRRRDRRRRFVRHAAMAAGLLAALAVILLAFDAAKTASTPTPRYTSVVRHTPGPTSRAGPRPYAETLAPIQIHPRIALALRSGVLFDVHTGAVMWARRPWSRLPIASLTKMMTALVTVGHSKPTGRVLITRQAVDFTGSGVGLLPLGKRVSELALLYGLLLPSGNDAAIALAQHVARTQPRFVSLMNAQARRMGLTCTRFATVSGVVDRGNYSCAVDLAAIARAVLHNRVLAPIVASPAKILRFPIKGGKLFLTNNNPLLLSDYPGTDGVKTGFTTSAGLCIVAAARRGTTWLAVVLLHSANWQTQAEALLNAGFAAVAARHHPRRASSRTTPA